MLDGKWLTIEEAAKAVGCTDGYVRLLLRQEKISGKKIGERLWLVDVDSVRDFACKPQLTGRPRSGKGKVVRRK